jgi:hypothetical protein
MGHGSEGADDQVLDALTVERSQHVLRPERRTAHASRALDPNCAKFCW